MATLRSRIAKLERALVQRGATFVFGSAKSEAEEAVVLARLHADHPGAIVILRRIVRPGFPGWPSLAAEHARGTVPAGEVRP